MLLPTDGRFDYSGHIALNFGDFVAASLHLVSSDEPTLRQSPNGGAWIPSERKRLTVLFGGRLGSIPGSVLAVALPIERDFGRSAVKRRFAHMHI